MACHLHALRTSPEGKRGRVWKIVAGVVGMVLCAGYCYTHLPIAEAWVVTCTAFLPLAFLMIRGVTWMEEHAARTQAASPRMRGMYGPVELTFSEKGMREITENGDSLATWNSIAEMTLDRDRIYLRLSNGLAAIVPKASYAGGVSFEDLLPAIREYAAKFGSNPPKGRP